MCKKLLWIMSVSLLFISGIVNTATSKNNNTDDKKQKTIIAQDNDQQYVQWDMDENHITKLSYSGDNQDNFYIPNKKNDINDIKK